MIRETRGIRDSDDLIYMAYERTIAATEITNFLRTEKIAYTLEP